MKKLKPSLIGLLQATGVFIYCLLMAGFFWSMARFSKEPPEFFGITLVLSLLVFSAAVTGSMVFAYPAYLALNQKIKEALSLVAYTLLYLLGIITIVMIVLFVLR